MGLGQHYDLLVNMIIRPPRFTYDMSDLGPARFSVDGKPGKRTDFELRNKRNMMLKCSHFEPLVGFGTRRPCVIYCHGNGGGRVDALEAVKTLIPQNITVFAVDFSGSGLSDGQYVSLGYWEKEDVKIIIDHLRGLGTCSTIGLWGRSMGAVTAVLCAKEDPSIGCILLDSPFSSLLKVSEELVLNVATLQKIPRLTKFAVILAMKAIRSSIKKKAQFDIKELEIMEVVDQSFSPALFVHGQNDTFIPPHHSEVLFAKYGGEYKNRVVVEGDHNGLRPAFFTHSAAIFFRTWLVEASAEHHQDQDLITTYEIDEMNADVLPVSLPSHDADFSRDFTAADLRQVFANPAMLSQMCDGVGVSVSDAEKHSSSNTTIESVVE